jgi:hypothetical protein
MVDPGDLSEPIGPRGGRKRGGGLAKDSKMEMLAASFGVNGPNSRMYVPLPVMLTGCDSYIAMPRLRACRTASAEPDTSVWQDGCVGAGVADFGR